MKHPCNSDFISTDEQIMGARLNIQTGSLSTYQAGI